MSENVNEPQDAPQEDEGVATTPETPEAGHVSSVTDLPEGAEVDPLTDAAPVQVTEDEPDDE